MASRRLTMSIRSSSGAPVSKAANVGISAMASMTEARPKAATTSMVQKSTSFIQPKTLDSASAAQSKSSVTAATISSKTKIDSSTKIFVKSLDAPTRSPVGSKSSDRNVSSPDDSLNKSPASFIQSPRRPMDVASPGSETRRMSDAKGSKLGSRIKMLSVSKALSQRLGPGQFSRRDGLIAFGLLIGVLVFSFSGGGVFMKLDGAMTEDKVVLPCVDIDVCTNASAVTMNSTIGSSVTTSAANESTIAMSTANSSGMSLSNSRDPSAMAESNPASACIGGSPSNETWEIWNECLYSKYKDIAPLSFSNASVYAWTVLTTIGYGQIVAMGVSSQAITIAYSLITIPMFFVFLAYVTELIRSQFAYVYDRVLRYQAKMGGKGRTALLCRCSAKCPDLVPFMIVFVFDVVFLFVTAGIFCAFKHEFDDYLHAYYYIYQSVALIGFGDKLPHGLNFQLLAILFIVFGIILLELVHLVMEEWMTKPMEWLIDDMTAETQKAHKTIAEQTLEEIMGLKPGEQAPPPTPPFADRPPDFLLEPTTDQPSSSIHVRPFNVSRFSLMQDLEDEVDTYAPDRL